MSWGLKGSRCPCAVVKRPRRGLVLLICSFPQQAFLSVTFISISAETEDCDDTSALRKSVVQLKQVTLLIAFICVKSSLWIDYSAYSYFEVVTICDLIMILAFYLVHLFRLYRVLTCINWPLSMQLSEDTSLQALTGASAGSRQDLQASDPGREASGSAFLCQSPAWLLANRRGPAAFLLPKKPLPWAP
ncbi:CKLF-like MARVEL transmembrane domain-containing protein 7 isoform X1 [Tamandua tetradactyla]|uniref:CKLF-like MARVEL transmembrane domain-containing protein 7 isoform X1 n=1 Tax=Tamandua tetradactyla TaxID=48850 RepID=UPI0040542E54